MHKYRAGAILAGLLVLAVVLALVMPSWMRFVVTIALAKGLVVLSLLLLMRSGLVSFGHGLYFGLGAYAAGLSVNYLGIGDAIPLLLGGVAVAALIGWILGFLMARYREIFFAVLNLAFSMILYGALVRSAALGSTDGFGLPRPTFLGYRPVGDMVGITMYMLTVVVVLVAAFAVYRYLRSARGAVGEAIRENELRVEYLGTSVRRLVHAKYVMSAALAGAGGALTAMTSGHIDPEVAYWTTSGEFVFVAILSGTGHVAAPFVGALLFEGVRTFAFAYSPHTWQLVLGITLLLVIIFMPGGLWSLFAARRRGKAVGK
jgi:ABC-type branched-subunit amino acid transport system permease subunit